MRDLGPAAVGAAVLAAGWAIPLVIAARVLAVAVAGASAWWLFPPGARPGLGLTVGLRFVREGINGLLPGGGIGGEVVAARLLARRGTPPALAAAGMVADTLAQAATQFAFAVLGLGLLLALAGDGPAARAAAAGLALAAPLLLAFALAGGRGAGRRLERAAARLPLRWRARAGGALGALYARLDQLRAHPGGLAAGVGLHLVGWLLGAAEVWVVLRAMGHPVGVGEAVAIEALSHAARGAAFAVPGGVGAQEAALAGLAALFGVPPAAGLACSLVKRVADLAVGLPGLAAWWVMEARGAGAAPHGPAATGVPPPPAGAG